MIALILRDFLAYRLAVDILATLGSGENRLATRVEQTSCSTRVANRFPPLAHSGEGDKQQTFSFSSKPLAGWHPQTTQIKRYCIERRYGGLDHIRVVADSPPFAIR